MSSKAKDQVVLERADLQGLLDALHKRGYDLIGPTLRDNAIVFESFHSDRLLQKIAAYNERHGLNSYPADELLDLQNLEKEVGYCLLVVR